MPTPDPLAGRTLTRWETATLTGECPYTVGPTYAERPTPRFEYKPSATGYTGGGYPRLRSSERGPESGHGSNDVFVSVHRLAAVVWCYPAEQPIEEVSDHLRGRDVHHQLGMPAANLPDHVEVLDHGEHSARTNAPDRTRQRAWFEDEKREAERRRQGRGDAETCDADGCDGEAAATFDGVGDTYCLECATTRADGRAIEVL